MSYWTLRVGGWVGCRGRKKVGRRTSVKRGRRRGEGVGGGWEVCLGGWVGG